MTAARVEVSAGGTARKGKAMAKTHYTATELTENAAIYEILRRKTACGSKATDRAQLYLSTDWADVDCIKCLAKREDVERIAAHRAEVARLKAAK